MLHVDPEWSRERDGVRG